MEISIEMNGHGGRRVRKAFFIICFISVLFVGACNSERTGGNNSEPAEEVNQELIEKGEKIVKSSCIGCHGADLRGDMGPNLHNLQLTKEEIIDVLIRGRGSMPPATAKDHEEAVALYLLSLQ